jgi:hypothetical protein
MRVVLGKWRADSQRQRTLSQVMASAIENGLSCHVSEQPVLGQIAEAVDPCELLDECIGLSATTENHHSLEMAATGNWG